MINKNTTTRVIRCFSVIGKAAKCDEAISILDSSIQEVQTSRILALNDKTEEKSNNQIMMAGSKGTSQSNF